LKHADLIVEEKATKMWVSFAFMARLW